MDLKVIPLIGRNMRGLAVRIRELDPDEANDVSLKAALLAGKDATGIAYRATELRMAILRSIHSYSQKTGLVSKEDVLALVADKATVWTPFSYEAVETDEKKLGKVFNKKEWEAIVGWYQRNCEVNQKEIEDIEGKALTVSVD